MCGPGSGEQQISNAETGFMQTLHGNYAQNFAEQQAVLSHLNSVLEPILTAGPNQTGFSAEEKAALNTQAINSTGANYKNAAVALNNQLAGRNDSGNLPESGVDQALKERLASSAAGELSQQQLGITEADYATGRSNFQGAVAGEEALAGQYNPVATGGLANTAGAEAFSQADQIQQQKNQEESDIAGGIASLAMAPLTGGISLAGLGKTFGGGGDKATAASYNTFG